MEGNILNMGSSNAGRVSGTDWLCGGAIGTPVATAHGTLTALTVDQCDARWNCQKVVNLLIPPAELPQ
jgi:hypothetical protein